MCTRDVEKNESNGGVCICCLLIITFAYAYADSFGDLFTILTDYKHVDFLYYALGSSI